MIEWQILLATTENNIFAKKGDIHLPWDFKPDMKFFRHMTTRGQGQNILVMGRGTAQSMQLDETKIVKDRITFIASRKTNTLPAIIAKIKATYQDAVVSFIGGQDIFRECLMLLHDVTIYKSIIPITLDESSHILLDPTLFKGFKVHLSDTQCLSQLYSFHIQVLKRYYPENEYLTLVKDVLTSGRSKTDRTGTGTRSLFGKTIRFPLSVGFPLLTTKKVQFRHIATELLWFIRGCTDNKVLRDSGVNIWNDNSTADFIKKSNLPYEPDDCGPIYGFQWRHFGAEYKTCQHDYKNQGMDQLKWVIQEIKKNPDSRRLIVSAWNPCDLDKMVLPPCHTLFQFYVENRKLSCSLYQRSGDIGLGVPYNIASYALLTHIVANVCQLDVGELVLTIGDAHIYTNHIAALQDQLTRVPLPFPKLVFRRVIDDIDTVEVNDFYLEGYVSHPFIAMKMAV